MSAVPVAVALDLERLPEGHRLRPVVDGALRKAWGPPPSPAPGFRWPAAFFGLDRSSAWRAAEPEARERARAAIERHTLAEAWAIEKAGMAFAAKMTLLARSTEERMLYALFAADEASHFAAFSAFGVDRAPANPFLDLLGRVIEEGDRATLVFVVQVVLEGWGLAWYRQLGEQALDPALAATFTAVLADEARHHGSGVVLAAEAPPRDAAVDVLAPFLDMVRAGPQAVAAAIEAGCGPVDRPRLFAELDAEAHAASRLALLRGLMLKAGGDRVVAALDARGSFTPLPPERCA